MALDQPDRDLVIVSGFGNKGGTELEPSLVDAINPAFSAVLASTHTRTALYNPEIVIRRVTAEMQEKSPNDRILVGHSYGALIALIVACRTEMHKILKLFLIDGPLRSDVEVEPVGTWLKLFYKHYEAREALALECEEALIGLDLSKIVTIGTGVDNIVSPEAKKLDGLQDIVLPAGGDLTGLQDLAPDSGANIVLPPEFEGHRVKKSVPIISRIIHELT